MAVDSEKQKLREAMQDMFCEMLELHKRMLLVAIELHKAMEEDGDPRGISNSNEFLSLMKQQRTLLILGMVHKANMADSEEECGKLIPFPVRATKANLEAMVRKYIPQHIERLAKEHAEIMRMAKLTGYFAWSLPKSCVSHVKTTTVTTYECANCNVLCNAKENFAGNGFDFLHRQLYRQYAQWNSWMRQFLGGRKKTLAELQPAIIDEACRKHLMEHFAKADTFDGQECHGCPIIRQSFAALQKQNTEWNEADEIH